MLARTVLVTAAASLAALGVAQPAAAAKPKPMKSARFSAEFDATYKTTWTEPKRLTGGSVCGGLNYQQGSGQEIWTVKTRKPQKLTAFQRDYGATFFHDTWDVNGDDADGIDAFGRHTRSGESFWSIEPGTCGGEHKRQPKDPNADCGTRIPEYVLRFEGFEKKHPEFSIAPHMKKEKLHFSNCTIRLADELTSGAWPKVQSDREVKGLFGKRKEIKISGSKSWNNTKEYDAKYWTTNSSLKWTLTLTRVKG